MSELSPTPFSLCSLSLKLWIVVGIHFLLCSKIKLGKLTLPCNSSYSTWEARAVRWLEAKRSLPPGGMNSVAAIWPAGWGWVTRGGQAPMRRGGLIAPVVSCSHRFKSQTEISIRAGLSWDNRKPNKKSFWKLDQRQPYLNSSARTFACQ